MTVANSGWNELIEAPVSGLPFLGNDAIEKLVADYQFDTVLDLGCGAGDHTSYFRDHGKQVTTLDAGHYHAFKPDYVGMYEDILFPTQFDCIWTSHVLEHVRNPGIFLDKVHRDLKEGGVLAITVPPLKHDLVSGHINLFNPGILVYQLIQAGFDCSKAAVKVYGYNISLIMQKVSHGLPTGTWSFPEVVKFFPFPVRQNSDGRIIRVNW